MCIRDRAGAGRVAGAPAARWVDVPLAAAACASGGRAGCVGQEVVAAGVAGFAAAAAETA
eukprot:4051122-Prymnesium_polylepis.1